MTDSKKTGTSDTQASRTEPEKNPAKEPLEDVAGGFVLNELTIRAEANRRNRESRPR